MTLKIGIIGLGVMGADHANIIYSKTANSTISAVYDSNIEHAQNISKLIGNPQVKDTADELINSPDVDAIMIISPDETHAELTLKCIDQKKPVLCEKPLSHSVIAGTRTQFGIHWSVMTAMSAMACLPVFAIALVAQKYLVRGLTLGAIK